MTGVLWETFWHIRQHLRICFYKPSSLHFWRQSMSLCIDMKMIRSLKIFRLSVIFLHHVLDFTEELQRSVPWENLPLEHDWFSVNIVQLTISKRLCKPFNSVLPGLLQIMDTLQVCLQDTAPKLKTRTFLLSKT